MFRINRNRKQKKIKFMKNKMNFKIIFMTKK